MKKKILVGLLVLASIVGIAYAAEKNWCATAKCLTCKAVYHNTVGATTKEQAIKEAKQMIDHESWCKTKSWKSSKVRATVAVNACPPAPASEYDGE